MDVTRRDWLRSAGSLALVGGVAGCLGGGDGGDSSGGEATGTSATGGDTTTASDDESGSGSATNETDSNPAGGTETATPEANPAATDVSVSVASDKQAQGLSFAKTYHYEMNGIQGIGGSLKNGGSEAAEDVTIHATVESGGGPFEETLNGPLPAGETTTFRYRFDGDVPDDVGSVTVWATTA
jgi:hypothetical protein